MNRRTTVDPKLGRKPNAYLPPVISEGRCWAGNAGFGALCGLTLRQTCAQLGSYISAQRTTLNIRFVMDASNREYVGGTVLIFNGNVIPVAGIESYKYLPLTIWPLQKAISPAKNVYKKMTTHIGGQSTRACATMQIFKLISIVAAAAISVSAIPTPTTTSLIHIISCPPCHLPTRILDPIVTKRALEERLCFCPL